MRAKWSDRFPDQCVCGKHSDHAAIDRWRRDRCYLLCLVLVVVVGVRGVTVLVVDVVHVGFVLHGGVAAVRTMLVAVDAGRCVGVRLALVVVVAMRHMRVAIVQEVGVAAVPHGHVSAAPSPCAWACSA